MSAAISCSTGKTYGIAKVCSAWGVARSSHYARKARRMHLAPPSKRGPRPLFSDKEVLALIRADLAKSPFIGEGHRKVWARLRCVEGVKVSRKRVLCIMRQEHLLSPHRVVQSLPKEHDGTIITTTPDIMWGTDGTKVFTIDEGWCWLFTAVEHWNAECVGWHVAKTGDRFAALQPLSMGLKQRYGSVGQGVARGLSLRMDNGSQYLSEHFQNQIKFWGIAPSFAFVAQPETNGVVERFNKTIKEQIIHGRHYRNVGELRTAVGAFVETYNRHWLIEKLGFKSPRQARQEFDNQLFKAAA